MSSFRKLLQVQMPDVYEVVYGQTKKVSDGEIINIMASVQPPQLYVYDQVKQSLGGARIDRVILVTTGPSVDLPTYDQHEQTLPAFFLWRGRRYMAYMKREGLAGVIPHMQYYAVQEQENKDE